MPNITPRSLRKNSTEPEKCLWNILRSRQLAGYKFRRQHPIGNFIADFACIRCRLIVEADGGQHANNPADAHRTKWLENEGWRVIRFWNNDILSNVEGVASVILEALHTAKPSPSQSFAEANDWAPPSPAKRERGSAL